MTDDRDDREDRDGPEDEEDVPLGTFLYDALPDRDPRHIDPAGHLADLVESGEFDIELADDQDAEELREFIERAEAGEFGDVDPGLEATVRIARALLKNADE